jgi:hypothetical protein
MTGITGGGRGTGERPGVGMGTVTTDKSQTMSAILTKIAYDIGGDETQYEFSMDATLWQVAGEKNYEMDIQIFGDGTFIQNVDMILVSPTVNQTMGMQLVLSPSARIPKTPVIAVLLDAWSSSLDSVWMKTQTMSYAMLIENANGSELDEWWGKLYNTNRRVLESDDDYRKRLQLVANILKGSGTKSNLEAIIDHIIGEPGATTVKTYWPGTVDISFNDSGGRIAKSKLSLLNYVIPHAIAVGMTYRIPLPFIDYYMDVLMRGDLEVSYTMGMRIGVPEINQIMSVLVAIELEYILHNMDMALQKDFDKSYWMNTKLEKDCSLIQIMDGLVFKEAEKLQTMSGILWKDNILTHSIDQLLLKEVGCSMEMSTALQVTQIRPQRMDITLVDPSHFHPNGIGGPTVGVAGALNAGKGMGGSINAISVLNGNVLPSPKLLGSIKVTTELDGDVLQSPKLLGSIKTTTGSVGSLKVLW